MARVFLTATIGLLFCLFLFVNKVTWLDIILLIMLLVFSVALLVL